MQNDLPEQFGQHWRNVAEARGGQTLFRKIPSGMLDGRQQEMSVQLLHIEIPRRSREPLQTTDRPL